MAPGRFVREKDDTYLPAQKKSFLLEKTGPDGAFTIPETNLSHALWYCQLHE
jgi:hypothetical protein